MAYMNHWLVKSEPGAWSWQDHVAAGTTEWDGVRNHQAANNMKAMKLGDQAFLYHSVHEKQIVGVLEVVKTYYPDPSDKTKKFGMVDFQALYPLNEPVTLQQIKADTRLAQLALVRQSRLSVMPIDSASWRLICKMGKIKP